MKGTLPYHGHIKCYAVYPALDGPATKRGDVTPGLITVGFYLDPEVALALSGALQVAVKKGGGRRIMIKADRHKKDLTVTSPRKSKEAVSGRIPRKRMSGNTLSIPSIAKRLDITRLAITNWLGVTAHQPKGRRPLPVATGVVGKSRRYRIHESDLLKWLHDYRPDLEDRWSQTSTLA